MHTAEHRTRQSRRSQSSVSGGSSRQHQGGPPAVIVKGRSGSLGGGESCRSLRAKHGRRRSAARVWEKKGRPVTGGGSGWQLARAIKSEEQPRRGKWMGGASFGGLLMLRHSADLGKPLIVYPVDTALRSAVNDPHPITRRDRPTPFHPFRGHVAHADIIRESGQRRPQIDDVRVCHSLSGTFNTISASSHLVDYLHHLQGVRCVP